MKKNIFILIAICANMGNLFCSQNSAPKLTESEKKEIKLRKFLNDNRSAIDQGLFSWSDDHDLAKKANFKGHINVLRRIITELSITQPIQAGASQPKPVITAESQPVATAPLLKPKPNPFRSSQTSPISQASTAPTINPSILTDTCFLSHDAKDAYLQDIAWYLEWKNMSREQKKCYCDNFQENMKKVENAIKSGWNKA